MTDKTSKIVKASLVSLVVLGTLGGLSIYVVPEIAYANRILPGIQLLNMDLGGKTIAQAKTLIARQVGGSNFAPLTLTYNQKTWEIVPKEFEFRPNDEGLAQALYEVGRKGSFPTRFTHRYRALTGQIQSPVPSATLYQFDRAKLTTTLSEIGAEINRPTKNAALAVKDLRATKFEAPQDGNELDVEETINLIAARLLDPDRQVVLPVKTVEPTVTLASTNQLGINTLLAQGESDFTGSPKNRRHNIGVGAARFDGLIIKPGETFSFVRNLGDVDARAGYLPELVIKGDKTEPEYGGGLCQVSTTAFRGILRSGLPISERRNHSYRVAYYEPAGTDATIYQPYPDLKFVNDTPGHLLIDTYIIGNKLYFDFYGTDTGRRVEMTGPYISNVTDFPEPIYIDTSTLPPGETKQIEIPHRGADAVLYRKVFKDGEPIINDTFKSHYIPWPAKFLRGVEEAAPVPTDLGNAAPPAEATDPAPPSPSGSTSTTT